MIELQKEMTKEELDAYNSKIAEQNLMYWYWRGKSGKEPDDFYVAWDADNCENNGWYHWKWIDELKYKTKKEFDDMNEWFCPSCRKSKQDSKTDTEKSEIKKSEGKFILTLVILTYLFVIKCLWNHMVQSTPTSN